MPVYLLDERVFFPPAEFAEKDGLLAVGGDLKVERLVLAYKMGIFPWYEESGQVLWWSPNPRCVLFPDDFYIAQSLRKILKRQRYRTAIDENFLSVVKHCAAIKRNGQEGTWILPEIISAYEDLHRLGYAHSFEIYDGDELVGGIYGVSLGRMFFGESMFSKVKNASKLAIAAVVDFCLRMDFPLIDCQIANSHLFSLGASQISRTEYLTILQSNINKPVLGRSWAGHVNPNFGIDLLGDRC